MSALLEVIIERLKEDIDERRNAKWEPNGWDAGAAYCLAKLREYAEDGGGDCNGDGERHLGDAPDVYED